MARRRKRNRVLGKESAVWYSADKERYRGRSVAGHGAAVWRGTGVAARARVSLSCNPLHLPPIHTTHKYRCGHTYMNLWRL